MRELRIVTFGAFTVTRPTMSRPATTAPAVLIVRLPEGVRVVPAGTPVLSAFGNPPEGGGGGGGDASTTPNVFVTAAVRPWASVTRRVTVRSLQGHAAPPFEYVN